MKFDKAGTLIVRVYTAGGALPVPNTVIRILGADEENRGIQYSVITDIDGVTEKIELPTPSQIYSQSPGAKERGYGLYNIEVSADGYYTKHIYNVAVFENVEAIQGVNMIPLQIYENGTTYPRNNLNTFVRENGNLE